MRATLTSLKNEGNAMFAAGEVHAALAAYQRGIQLIEKDLDYHARGRGDDVNGGGGEVVTSSPRVSLSEEVREEAEVRELHVLLYSNVAHVYLCLERYRESWLAAEAATALNPLAWKPWLRFIEARRRGGYAFDALVHTLRYLRPLLRIEREAQRMSAAEVAATLKAVEEPLCDEVGLLRLSPDIELVEYAGGVAMVGRRYFNARDVLFTERKYTRTEFGEGELMSQPNLTTESIVTYFAERLRPEQAAATPRWRAFTMDFTGAWPRRNDDIDQETRDTISGFLRQRFPAIPAAEFNELLSTALMCRYNCFHSGFFRTCALANHSCHANIAMKYDSADETVKMVAVEPIQPGALLNVKYLSDAHFVLGVGKRRELLRSWLFWCQCERCCHDRQPTTLSEFVECPSCHAYTHSALMGFNKASDPELLAEEPCRVCGAAVSWSVAQADLLHNELMHSFTCSTAEQTAEGLAEWMHTQLAQTELLQLHPENWVYRALFYFLTVVLSSKVDRVFAEFSESRLRSSTGEAVQSLFSPCGLRTFYLARCLDAREKAGTALEFAGPVALDEMVTQTHSEDGGGSEFLKSFVILWTLLASFYPVNEMWAVHDAVCKLVLLHLAFPMHAASLRPSWALTLLQRHGPYVGDREAARMMHAYGMHKTAFHAKECISLAKLKKAFRGE